MNLCMPTTTGARARGETPADRLARDLADTDLGLRRGVVALAPASDAWPLAFAAARSVLAESAPSDVLAIEHIGSTSIAGLDAKPILDIAVVVSPGTVLASLDDWLTSLGMLLRGDANDIRPDRMYGYELQPMIRLANVHVVEDGSEQLRHYLAFRDHLRAHPADRDAYGALKHAMAAQHPNDRLAYIDGKADFIRTRRGDAA